jgi:hypothetical protein
MKNLIIAALALIALVSCAPKQPCNARHTCWAYDATIYELNTRQLTPEGTFKAAEEAVQVSVNAFPVFLTKVASRTRLKFLLVGVEILYFTILADCRYFVTKAICKSVFSCGASYYKYLFTHLLLSIPDRNIYISFCRPSFRKTRMANKFLGSLYS